MMKNKMKVAAKLKPVKIPVYTIIPLGPNQFDSIIEAEDIVFNESSFSFYRNNKLVAKFPVSGVYGVIRQ